MAAPATSNNDKGNASQEFLDAKQYARKSVEKYERIFGTDFVSTGGVTTTAHFCDVIFNGLSDKYGCNNKGPYRVLDIGCGIGGSAFYMAKNYNVCEVIGIDLSANMINIANEKVTTYKAAFEKASSLKEDSSKDNNKDKNNNGNGNGNGNSEDSKDNKDNKDYRSGDIGPWINNVKFEIADALKLDYEENTFDLIYSRDTILHILDKSRLFELCYKWLKPNGMLYISDYCCSEPSSHSDKFKAYLAKRGYHLYTPMAYGKLIGDCGFERVTTEDRTKHMISILKAEKVKFEKIKDVFIKDFSEDDYLDILNGWNDKIGRCGAGEQRWATFVAMKTLTFDE